MLERVVRVAKKEFIKKGYKEVELEHISRKYHIPLKSIRGHYATKDELFCEILAPQTDEILREMEAGRMLRTSSVVENRQELDLLFNRSEGSSLGDFLNFVSYQGMKGKHDYYTRFGFYKSLALMVEDELDDQELGEAYEFLKDSFNASKISLPS